LYIPILEGYYPFFFPLEISRGHKDGLIRCLNIGKKNFIDIKVVENGITVE